MDAGAGADIDDMIGREDRVLVMFDDDDGIAEIAQPPQRLEQARIVALVQADRRLVEHIEHAGQARADLRGEPDALALAARQRAGAAREREIIEPDIDEKGEPVANFLQDAHGDLVALGVELLGHAREPVGRGAHGKLADLADVAAVDLHRERLGLQPVALAGRAGRRRHEAPDLLARPFAFGFEKAALEIADDAFERLLDVVGAQAVVVGELHRLFAGAVEQDLLDRGRQRIEGRVEAELVVFRRAPRASADNRARSISPRARSRPCAG